MKYILKNQEIAIDNFNSDDEIMRNTNGELKNISLEGKKILYCFNYALKDNRLSCIEDTCEKLDFEYKNINFKQIRKNDIIEFRDFNGTVHFGRIWKKRKSLLNTIIRSKFGQLGVYQYCLKNNPTCYGNELLFWRKK